MTFGYNVCVIGGCGHVGLPLGLSFAKKGLKVLAIDINKESIAKIMNKEMPFLEKNAEPILKEVVTKGNFYCTDDQSKVSNAEYVIIVPGTPVDFDLIPDLTKVESIIRSIIPHLQSNQILIFRSTLAPKSTDYIKNFIENNTKFVVGKNLFISFAPERIVQSDAIMEIESLPQIIGVYDDLTYKKVKDLFDIICSETIRTTPLEAELAKLFTNSYRYVNFALANEFFIIANSLDANIFNIVNAVKHNYPRANVPKPGFAKGPCLGKDAWILLSSSPNLFSFTGVISSAFRVNEGLPYFIFNEVKKRIDTSKAKIAVLGLTFKKDCDDTRDSLSMKLLKILKNEFVSFETHDPYVDKKDIKKFLEDKNVVIITINHSFYEDIDITQYVKKGTLISDIWNTQKRNNVFFKA